MAGHNPDKEMMVVEKGDTLYSLAKKNHTSADRIMEVNHLKGTTIYTGQRLILSDEQDSFHKIMAGSFSNKENAEKRVSFLKEKNIPAAIGIAVIDGKSHYRVQAGAFKDKKNAEKQLEAVKKAGVKDAYFFEKEQLHIFGLKPGDTYEFIFHLCKRL
ncbi:hypothetical protein NCCP133_22150 [Cytobacillus sp. NCCP-133]|nr:hypothetical protein NCCP133_22150 [Cytobacillus sp. NCCP-133]